MRKVLFIIIAGLCIVSCAPKQEEAAGKKGSSGKTCELMVVADREVYTSATKELVQELFAAPQEGLLRGDPMFDIVNIPSSSFQNTEMFRVHRNILYLNVNEANSNKILRSIDNYAAPQVIYEIAARDRRALDSLLRLAAPRAIADMRAAEHTRIIKAFQAMRHVKAMRQVREHMGFGLVFSDEFEVAKMEPDFVWVRKEAKDFGIGVLAQTLPYTDRHQLDTLQILNLIDTVMRRHVPGPAEGSYMGLERKNWVIAEQRVTLAAQPAIELRGMWRTFGDFMGGPFVAYTLATPDHKRLVLLVAYVYAPRATTSMPYPMRDLLMQTESICWSLEF